MLDRHKVHTLQAQLLLGLSCPRRCAGLIQIASNRLALSQRTGFRIVNRH